MFDFLIQKGLDIGLKAVGIGTEDELDKAMKKGLTPEQMTAWKQAQFEGQRLADEDRQNAREMNMNRKDLIVPTLAFIAVMMIPPLFWLLFTTDVPEENVQTVNMLIGNITGFAAGVYTFYFGSSHKG